MDVRAREWRIGRGALGWVPVYAGIGLTVSAVGSWLVHERLMYPVETLAGTLAEERAEQHPTTAPVTTTEDLA